MASPFLLYDGSFYPASEPLLPADNRAFRYGEGLFETMRLSKNSIPLWELHWNRLQNSMPCIGITGPVHWTKEAVFNQIQKLVQKNHHQTSARIRLTVFKGEGGIREYPSSPFHSILQSWNLPESAFTWNENGLQLGIFLKGKKACDHYSHLKSSNYLLYLMAAQDARERKWNESLVLNQYGRVSDASIANVFFIKDGVVYTPSLEEGGVAGVMRQYLIQQLRQAGRIVQEGAYTLEDIEAAEEIFLTNAVQGIRWVQSFNNHTYRNRETAEVYRNFLEPLCR
jgi:branched-chain amino acid aminotransferase